MVLRLKEKITPYKAVQKAFLNMQYNNGKLIEGPKKNTTVVQMGPRGHPLQSEEIEFPSKLSYPYKFTCVVSNLNSGDAGNGNFSFQVFSRKELKAQKMN